jgi:hypothetical protein
MMPFDLSPRDFENCPDHPIIDQPSSPWLLEFTYHNDLDTYDSFVDLVFLRNGKQRRLRFSSPTQFSVGPCWGVTSALHILDVSEKEWEDCTVAVISRSDNTCDLFLLAKNVIQVAGDS